MGLICSLNISVLFYKTQFKQGEAQPNQHIALKCLLQPYFVDKW